MYITLLAHPCAHTFYIYKKIDLKWMGKKLKGNV